ncbi:ef-hand domain c-terminal containing protein [Holotrichia oblita]|uniref:Ef-hand domain c-terminal containing protein n=1 Tax=Holotrichia oblita TaxID=644536 RepID=A0ACB9TBV2_HOLOL|nr:ef-hand domain c-terminal containing protein [Holotrichia oblita]
MSNKGKYIDRAPIICAAGLPCDRKENAKDCLQYYRIVDKIDAVKHDLHIEEKEKFPFHPQRSVNTRHPGIYIETKDLIRPKPVTRYETVINDLKETTFVSHWDQELGKTRDSGGAFPEGMDVENTTFDHGVAELVNPKKSHFEVLFDSQEYHDMYRKSHNDYNPSERIDRGYLKPAFDPDKRYGMTTIYDPKGIWVKCATTWHLNDPLETANVIQSDYAEKSKPILGKALSPNKNINKVPKDYRFGKSCVREMCGVLELLRDPTCHPCRIKRELYYWIASLNKLRDYIKRRRNKFIDLKEIQDKLVFYDKEKTGWLPVGTLIQICQCFNVWLDKNIIRLATLLEIIRDDKIDYNEFLTLIDVNKPCPQLMTIKDVRTGNMYYTTTNMAAMEDRCFIDNSDMRPAGLPTIRTDIGRPRPLAGQCKADIESLGQETNANAVINPSIFTNYGLSHRDFCLPRQPEYIRRLFENTGYEFPGDTFDKLWKIGVDLDKTGLVCIDTFKQLIAETLPPPKLKTVKENKCQY